MSSPKRSARRRLDDDASCLDSPPDAEDWPARKRPDDRRPRRARRLPPAATIGSDLAIALRLHRGASAAANYLRIQIAANRVLDMFILSYYLCSIKSHKRVHKNE